MLFFLTAAFAVDIADCTVLQSTDDPAEVRPVGDLDADGIVDVAVTGETTLQIHLSDSPGSPIVAPHLFAGSAARADGGDLTGDGVDDLLVTTPAAYCVGFGCGDRRSEIALYAGPLLPGALPAPVAWWRVRAGIVLISGDHNADGQLDVGFRRNVGSVGYNEEVWTTHEGGDVLALRGETIDDGTTVLRSWEFSGNNGGYSYFRDYSTGPLGDFDGDGRADVIFGNPNTGNLTLARGREVRSGAPPQGRTRLTDEEVVFMTAGFDAQGDGLGDLLAVAGRTVWLTSGATTWQIGQTYNERNTSTVWRLPANGRSVAYAGNRFGDGQKWMLVDTDNGAWFARLPPTPTVAFRTLPTANPLTEIGGQLELNYDDLGWPADIDGDGDDELLIMPWIGSQRVACAL
jgi:hypothetical protein